MILKVSKNCMQNYYLFGFYIVLFFCINIASALSQKTTCYFEYKKVHYSAIWEAYKTPSEGGVQQVFDVIFAKISAGTPINLLSSTISPFNPSMIRFDTTYHIRNPNAEYVQTAAGFEYRAPEGSSITLPIPGLLSYAESVNTGAKNNIWWRISSNDNSNKEWTIEFSYKNIENKVISVSSKNAACKVSYSINTDTKIVSPDTPACGSGNYTRLYNEIYGVEEVELTCSLL